jgi:PP-loop superfamily ATP-utilizing enzyme
MGPQSISQKMERLKEIIGEMDSLLVAFSGGVDSSFLLKVARETLGPAKVVAVTARSPVYPKREYAAARKLAKDMDVQHLFIDSNELDQMLPLQEGVIHRVKGDRPENEPLLHRRGIDRGR